MDPTNQVILSTLYTLNQPTSVNFLWKQVNARKLIRINAFQSRIALLNEQGFVRLDTAGRNTMLVSITQAGIDTLANLQPAADSKASQQSTGQPTGTSSMQMSLLIVLAGSLVILLLCAGLFLARWQRGITIAQRQMTPLPDTALSTPALALAATRLPENATGIPSLTPPPTLTPAASVKTLRQTSGASQLDDLNMGVNILIPIIEPASTNAERQFNRAANDYAKKEQELARQILQQPLPGAGGFLHLNYTVVSAAGWQPDDHFPYTTRSAGTLPFTRAVASAGHQVLSVLFASERFFGGAHPGMIFEPLNYDFDTQSRLSLSDLFQPGAPYLETIASYCITELPRRYGDQLFDDFRKGAKATPENYRVWAVTRSGLLVVFGEYQLAPYVAGPQYVLVPYEKLSQIIDPNGPIGQYAQ